MFKTVRGEEDYNAFMEGFRKKFGLHRIIAFSGGSDSELSGVPADSDIQKSYKSIMGEVESRIIGEAIKILSGYDLLILTGGTSWGVPKTATLEAKRHGLKTLGVYPLAGKKHALGEDLLDISLCVEPLFGESRWGDESPIFTSLLDGVIVYGGGAGTLVEVSHILKTNEAIIKSGKNPKYIVPLSGTGGVADGLPFVWGKSEVKAKCMPFHRVVDGVTAAKILVEQLDLYDFAKE